MTKLYNQFFHKWSMFSSKKGLENYIVVLLGLGLVMSLLLMYFLDLTFGSDHPSCQQVNVEFEVLCKDRGIPRILVTNNGPEELFFFLNGQENVENYRVQSQSSKELRVPLRDANDITLLPLAREEGLFYECRGRSITRNAEVVTRC